MAEDRAAGLPGAWIAREADPIIVTLQFDAVTQDYFERMRRAHFPPALNTIPAHLTLFHQLPGEDPDWVMAEVGKVAARHAPFTVLVESLMPLGRGVAYRIASPELKSLRKALAAPFEGFLWGQDRQGFRPHVTVQNKVTPERARETLAALSRSFEPSPARAEGLQLWYYRGGPWEALAAVGFRN